MNKAIKNSLNDYARNKTPTGGFLYAVLCNNLMEAFGRADTDNQKDLFEICSYIYNELSTNCYGSKEKVDAWLASR